MSLPDPRSGLVISYSYLWTHEQKTGREEGVKDRPCAIVAARQIVEGRVVVTVLPVTHAPPDVAETAIEIPAAIKTHLGLDAQRSWIVLNETNDFLWPGPDIRKIPGSSPSRFAYGMLPPRFYAHVRDMVLMLNSKGLLTRVNRTD